MPKGHSQQRAVAAAGQRAVHVVGCCWPQQPSRVAFADDNDQGHLGCSGEGRPATAGRPERHWRSLQNWESVVQHIPRLHREEEAPPQVRVDSANLRGTTQHDCRVHRTALYSTTPTLCTAAAIKVGQHRELSRRDAHGSKHFRAAHIHRCTRSKHDSQHKHTLCSTRVLGGKLSWGSGVDWRLQGTRLHTLQCDSEPLNG